MTRADDCRKAINRAINLLLVGDLNDNTYVRELEKYHRQLKAYDATLAGARDDTEVPKRPVPPKLAPNELTAVANAIRAWLECKTHQLEEKVDEMLATNHQLLTILEERRNQGGGGKPH